MATALSRKQPNVLHLTKRLAAVSAFLIAVLGGILAIGLVQRAAPASPAALILPTSSSTSLFQRDRLASEEAQTTQAVQRASEAVVSITMHREEACQNTDAFEDIPPELQRLFDLPSPEDCQRSVGAGSGFLISPDGYLLTNHHVIEQRDITYTVLLNGKRTGQKKTARIVLRDVKRDIAILKIDGKDYPSLRLADSNAIQIGQTAIAIGFALGEFDNTVSKGIISGVARSIEAQARNGSESLSGLIQTDAAINPGNSGGPLIDIQGNVIGMNTAIALAENIGFAIPSNDIKAALEDAKKSGAVTF